MRVRVDTYEEFKAKAAGGNVYYSHDPAPTSEEAPLFFLRAMVAGVTVEYWDRTKPATFDIDFPNAVLGTMED